MLSGFDFNKNYLTLGERLLAAKSALRATNFGLGGAIRVEEDPENLGKIHFVLSSTGESFKSMTRAIDQASAMFVSQTVSVTDPKMGNKLAGLGSVMKNIRENVSTLTDQQKRFLTEAGIDVNRIPTMEVDMITLSGGSSQDMAKKVLAMREANQLHGLASVDDKGGRMLTMRLAATGNQEAKMLTSEQINLLLRVTGHGMINEDSVVKAMSQGDVSKLAEKLLKFGKRERTFVSERELSFAGDTFSALSGGRAIEDAFLVLDPQYEMMRMFAKETLGSKVDIFGGDKALKAYYKDRNIDSYFGKYLDPLTDAERKRLAQAIEKHAKTAKKGKGKFASDQLADLIETEFSGPGKGNKKILKAFKESYASIEYGFDGSDLLNQKFMKDYKGQMKLEIDRLKALIGDVNLSSSEKSTIAVELKNLENIFRQIGDLDFSQIIGRGNIPGLGNIKTAFDLSSNIFRAKDLRDKVGIISKFGLKSELGMAREEGSLLLAGFGRVRDLVYSDPVSAAFHPEIFADPETLQAIETRAQDVLAEFQSSLQTGVVPKKLRAMLKEQMDRPIEFLPSEARASALRNRQFASAINQMLESGVNPSQSPRMMNMLHKIFATQVYRTEIGKDGSNIFKLALPETYRFELDTEKSLRGREAILGRGFEEFKAQGMQESADILVFRAKGHKMYFAPGAVGQVRGSLGGFDLDDKGMAKMFRYTDDNGMTRIAFNLTRVPSGAEEKMLGRAVFDEDTIRALFTKHTDFRKALDELIVGRFSGSNIVDTISTAFIDPTQGPNISAAKEYNTLIKLQEIIEGKSIQKAYSEFDPVTGKVITRVGRRGETTRIRAELESAIDTVYRQMEQMGLTKTVNLTTEQIDEIARKGTGSLHLQKLIDKQGNPTAPRYTRAGIYNIFSEQGAFDMADELRTAVNNMPIDNAFKTSINTAPDFKKMIELVGKEMEKPDADPRVMAAFESAFRMKSIKSAATGGDILGSYINRSMVIGSTLNQYEALLNQSSTDIREFLLKNFQIGLLSQEEAIDYAVNATGASRVVDLKNLKTMHEASTALLAQAAESNYYDLEGITRSVNVLLNNKPTADLGLGAIGEAGVGSLGRLIGATRAIGSQNQDLLLGIDELLIKERLNKGDTKILLQNIVKGMEEAYGFNGALKTTEENVKLYSELKETLEKFPDNSAKIQEVILKNFALSAEHRYASLSKMQSIGQRLEAYFEAVKRTNIANLEDDIIKGAKVTGQSEAFAENFMARNREFLDEIFRTTSEDFKRMSSSQLASHKAKVDYLSGQLLKEIDEASQIEGMSMETLVNSLDLRMRGTRYDMGSLSTLRDAFDLDSENIIPIETKYEQARRIRTARYYQSFDQDFAEKLTQRLNVQAGENLSEVAERLIVQSNNDDDLTRATLNILSGADPREINNELLRNEAITQSRIIQENHFLAQQADEIDELSKMGTISTVEDIVQQFGDDAATSKEVLNTIIDYENNDPVNKAVFKKFSQKIKDGDFKQLFKDPLIKRSTLALGALVAGSFVYTAIRDRTASDMSGPPLLPGGSAYEQNYPTRIPEIGSFSGQGYDIGNSYNVSINGSYEDVQRFNEAAGGLVNGSMSTTIFDRIPDVRQDLYSMFGASY